MPHERSEKICDSLCGPAWEEGGKARRERALKKPGTGYRVARIAWEITDRPQHLGRPKLRHLPLERP
jgi:hypothetical protein